MSSFYLPLSRDTSMELVINDNTDDLMSIYIDGKLYDPYHMFSPLAVFFLECCMEQKSLIKRDLVSDVTKLSELEFCHSKFMKARF